MNTFLNKKFFLAVAVLVLGLGFLAFFGRSNRQPQQTVDPNVVVRQLLREPTEVISGTITEIKNDQIILDVPEVLGVGIPPSADVRHRIVRISSDTTITARVPKNEDALLKELKRYRPDAGTPPPSSYIETTLKSSELKRGDFVFVRGASGVDLREAKEIVAVSIIKS